MILEAFHPTDDQWWARVHVKGCRYVDRETRRHGGRAFELEASTQREAIEAVAGDFIYWNDQQPWTDYIGQVNFAPCVDLPLESEGGQA